jgi:hypothetical protein
LKTVFLIISIIVCLQSCSNDISSEENEFQKDTIAPVLKLEKKIDTAYLNTLYEDPQAELVDRGKCINAEITGSVNTAVMGTYYLDYDYTDEAGNQAATVTRTVHVVENGASYLNGKYNVAFTCTASHTGVYNPTITTANYSATVSTSNINNRFEIIQLKIGPEAVIPISTLRGNSIHLEFYRNSECISSGTVSSSKNSFTIQTSTYDETQRITHVCKNVFTKKFEEKNPKKTY